MNYRIYRLQIEEYTAHPDRVSEADFARYLDDILESVNMWILKTRNTELLLNSRKEKE